MAPSNLSWEQSPRAPSNPGPLGAKAHRMPSILLSSAFLLPVCTKRGETSLGHWPNSWECVLLSLWAHQKTKTGDTRRHLLWRGPMFTSPWQLQEGTYHQGSTESGALWKRTQTQALAYWGEAMHTLGVPRGCDILSDQQAWKLTWFVQLRFLTQAEELSIAVYKMWSKDPKEFWQPAFGNFFHSNTASLAGVIFSLMMQRWWSNMPENLHDEVVTVSFIKYQAFPHLSFSYSMWQNMKCTWNIYSMYQ